MAIVLIAAAAAGKSSYVIDIEHVGKVGETRTAAAARQASCPPLLVRFRRQTASTASFLQQSSPSFRTRMGTTRSDAVLLGILTTGNVVVVGKKVG